MSSPQSYTLLLTLCILIAPFTYAATCNDQSISGTPSKEEITEYLKSQLSAGTICSDQWPPTEPLTVTYNANNMFFKRTRTSADISMTHCNDAFTNIIEQCVLGESKWGGEWELDGQSYSITNNVYPENGIVLPGSNTQTSSDAPVSSRGPAIQSGPFTTDYISGVKSNTVTTTKLDDQSSSTVLPIWFCPGCDAVAAGILVIPLGAPVAGALIPPPPGFPPLTIGPDGAPTATGDPAPGNQPTGDPRPTNDGNPQSTKDDSQPSPTPTPTPTPSDSQSSSTSTSSDSSSSSVVELCPNEKRDSAPSVHVLKREVVHIRGSLVKRAEDEAEVASPLREALSAIGGPDVLLSSRDFKLVVNKMPKEITNPKDPSGKSINQLLYAYVTGIEAKASESITIKIKEGDKITRKKTLKEGDNIRIRWDWDPTKGVHINCEFGTTDMYKIAFKPSGWKISPSDPTTYEKVIRGQSAKLNYNSEPAPKDQKPLTPEQRTGSQGQGNPQAALSNMAQELVKIWKSQVEDCQDNGQPSG